MNREKCILNCLKKQKKIAKIIDWYEKKGDYILNAELEEKNIKFILKKRLYKVK